jgi:hypothetical protein
MIFTIRADIRRTPALLNFQRSNKFRKTFFTLVEVYHAKETTIPS